MAHYIIQRRPFDYAAILAGTLALAALLPLGIRSSECCAEWTALAVLHSKLHANVKWETLRAYAERLHKNRKSKRAVVDLFPGTPERMGQGGLHIFATVNKTRYSIYECPPRETESCSYSAVKLEQSEPKLPAWDQYVGQWLKIWMTP